ncbi:helix-turn-helix domain-containing protein [Sinosporangium siamense]|uniref:Transcriptional regulator n=1 Tax=Sinosporangium siamense TaxID=1367973 RepID=A0A919RH06_9ACTN|nr:helix-turn-helix domain-containing protein [Sinosporangium siamense]GII92234.1 transcriptional regulator [Sinosporangium siamense]
MNGIDSDLDVVREAERLRGTLSPLRRRLLEELREPASATGLSTRLGESRQRINYHLRELEKAGLVELVELRQRRGRTERLVRVTARAVVVAPEVIGELGPAGQDRFAASTLIASSARTLADVAEMREAAAELGKRLLTFHIETEVRFARPADVERFATRLAEAMAEVAAEFDTPGISRRYRVTAGGHPAKTAESKEET